MKVALLAIVACAHPRALPAIELVESVPTEARLDNPDIANADAVWLDMITHATTSLYFAEFYASNEPDSKLEPIVRAIEAALVRGVKVRFLVETSFVRVYPETLARLERGGAVVRPIDVGGGGILHAKYFIVDDRDAFIGSQNFDWRALDHNLELGVRIRDGVLVDPLVRIFAADWSKVSPEQLTPRVPGHTPRSAAVLVASPRDQLPHDVPWELPKLVELLDGAKHTIHAQMLTYRAGDWDELDAPLRRAAARGVEVELAVADWAKRDKTLVSLRELARVPQVTVRFITIPQAKRGFIPFARVAHAKLLVVDGLRGWLGTSNWEREYFYLNRNVGLVFDDVHLAAQLERFFTDAQRYAIRLDPDATYTPPRIE